MFKKMYYTLYNHITDAVEQIERQDYQGALVTLEQAQRETEQMYVESGEE